MSMTKLRRGGLGAFATALPLFFAGCLDPGHPAVSAQAESPAAGQGLGALERRLMLWDGADIKPRVVGTGRSGHFDFWDGGASWAACDSKPNCKAALAAANGAGFGGGKGLKFHGEGAGWIGSGWSWFEWYPPNAGTDVRAYKDLTFEVRIEAASAAARPDAANVAVQLSCSDGPTRSVRVNLSPYAPTFADGQWHPIRIPLTAFAKTWDGGRFCLQKVWELGLSTWSPSARNFDMDVDRIAVEN